MYLQDDLLKESVTYQRILNDGVKIGVQREFDLIHRQLKKRFGEVSETLKPKINTLSIEQLELFGESLFDFNSIDDANKWLDHI